MRKRITPTSEFSIRFRRWTRKSYAVFAGLGKQISIGCLRKGLIDSSLKKQEASSSNCRTESDSIGQNITQSSETEGLLAVELCPNFTLLQTGILTHLWAKVVAEDAAFAVSHNKLLIEQRRESPATSEVFFSVFYV